MEAIYRNVLQHGVCIVCQESCLGYKTVWACPDCWEANGNIQRRVDSIMFNSDMHITELRNLIEGMAFGDGLTTLEISQAMR